MAVTYTEVRQLDVMTYRLSWTTDLTPPVTFRVFSEGRLVTTFESDTQAASYDIQVAPGHDPFVEVLDNADAIPQLAFPGALTVHWTSVAGAAKYRIDEYVSSTWTERTTIDDDGSAAYEWLSRWLEDVTTHQFRVVPIGADGNEAATPLAFSCEMVRHPNVPTYTTSYNAGTGNITITVTA